MTEEQHKKIAEMMNHSYDESIDYLIHKNPKLSLYSLNTIS